MSTPPDEKRPTILVVDDDVALLRAVVGLLARLDCDIVSSSSSRAALELLHEREFAVGLFDVQMPGMNGIELARRARQLPRARSMPIVFVTSLHDQAELVFAGYESGAVDVLSKPVDSHILTSKVNVFLDLHRSKRQLEDEVRAHQLALADLDAFAYSVSHDLRAPLRAVSGFAAILAEDHGAGLPEAARALLDDITSAAGTMDRLIDDLLRLSRVGRARAEREPIDLRALAGPIVDELRRIDPGRDVTVVLPDAQPVRGDGPLLRIALENLLRNAWKFTSKRPGARIELGARREGEEMRHFVRDDGVGFDAAKARTLFKPFQRFHPRSEFDGTGIGLAIVERVIRHHGGRVWADSVPGQGATFWFTLE